MNTTVEEVMHVLYTVLCTKTYTAAGYYTVVPYASDPLYTVKNSEFVLDPILNKPKFKPTPIGPAA